MSMEGERDMAMLEAQYFQHILIYRQRQLWHDKSVDNQKHIRRISNDAEKYAVPKHERFVEYAIPLWDVYEICSADIVEPKIERLEGAERFFVLLKNLYRPQVLDDERMRNVCHSRAAKVIRSANVRRVDEAPKRFLAP